MDKTLPIVAHPTFTRAVLRLSLARRTEIYVALRAVERGDEELKPDSCDIYHIDLAWTPKPHRVLVARGFKKDREVALAVNAFPIDPGATTSAGRINAAKRAWDAWCP